MRDDAPTDIQSRNDVHSIVDAFYRDIADDPVLGSYFADIDLESHVPKLVDFWTSVVFQSATYRGQPFEAHAALDGLEGRHFRRWLDRFETTVDARFAGTNADRMKQRARQIATIFQSKLGVLDETDVARRFQQRTS
ncbi:hypothetical protein CRI94_00985 [Longibacter salinarum]|uniref:Sec-independent protein translocase TatC n=1 Tax=Longibacter salinarum TaxID=1850348 RepID=A0A2A8D1Y5_9BACT|nr:group III truncated hemoglobin [Longibacter salinarum]PEN14901.1 hypothetical protein CRI94_00985 [Longibacter salinarum]